MRRRFKINIAPRYILLGLTVLCLILIFISFKYSEAVAPAKTMVGRVMTPMQKGINEVGNFIHSKVELINSIEDLTAENNSLKEEINQLKAENNNLLQDKYELETFRKLYDLDQDYKSYPKIAARVISYEPNNWDKTITIDKGSRDGLKVDMNVIADEGLVGIITKVGYNNANIRLIVDDSSNVGGMFRDTGDTCNIKGNLELFSNGLIEMNTINKDAVVTVGNEVVTSRKSTKFLPGIVIGYVDSISLDSNNMSQSGLIRPAVDFSKLDTVLVITELKEQLLDEDPNATPSDDANKDGKKASSNDTNKDATKKSSNGTNTDDTDSSDNNNANNQ